jgi:predicted O-linked N-acetylglucosamine transferase (SPINDLY family)
MKLCEWGEFSKNILTIEQGILENRCASTPFPVLSFFDRPELHLLVSKIYSDLKYKNLCLSKAPFSLYSHGKIRIGYYSADFHNHATSYLMAELFELHDKSKFEIFGFSFGPVNNDDMQVRVSSAFDHFYFVNDKSDHDVASLSRQLGIDIAIDLKGFTQDYRLGIFAYGCAPIQVNYLGYPGTMGTDFIHYVIADITVIPETNQQFFTEKVVYLPHSYQVNDSKRAISDRLFTKPEVGLPGSGFVFSCFNNVYKILPSTFDGWMRILKSIDGSVLWLLDDNPTATSNLQKEAQARGVDPSRLVFAKRMSLDEHLARLKLADLFIDTLPYNAHTTTSDALWAGLPVLTCMGESFASRVAASLLKAIDLPELITHSQQEYEAKAIELATNPALLKAIKDKLAANKLTKPLFDTKLFTKHLEAAYSSMYQRHQDGLPPDHVFVSI